VFSTTDTAIALQNIRTDALTHLPDVRKAITEFMSELGLHPFTRYLRQGSVPAQAMAVINQNNPEVAHKFIEEFESNLTGNVATPTGV
jgi:hypothetical protein